MNEKITAIIPCYNAQKTIEKTIDSIKAQTYSNFEVIIVNDGSTDKSLEILNKISEKDNRFKIINIPNGGVSNARNVGLDNVEGEIVIFLDADDTITKEYFSNILNDIENNDLLVYSYKTLNNKQVLKTISCNDKITSESGKIDFCRNLTSSQLFAPVWNKVFLMSNIKDIRFDTSTNLGEDYEFVMHYFLNIDTYKYINKSFYIYDLTTGNLGFSNKKNSYELKSKGNFRKLELYQKYNYPLTEVYKEFVKAFILDMMNLMIYQKATKKEMLDNQKHCMQIFDLTKVKLSIFDKLLVNLFICKSKFVVKISSYMLNLANKLIKKIKCGY